MRQNYRININVSHWDVWENVTILFGTVSPYKQIQYPVVFVVKKRLISRMFWPKLLKSRVSSITLPLPQKKKKKKKKKKRAKQTYS